MARWGMVLDLDKCTGCGACQVVCRQENNVPPTDEATFDKGRQRDWLQILTRRSEGEGQHEQFPLFCLQCDEPPCIKVCPVRATYKDEDGTIGQIYNRCIGCRYCTNACPYSVKAFNWFAPKWPEGMERRLNPDVSVRPVGVVEKCTFCHHRKMQAREQARAEGRSLRAGDYTPACVEICPTTAMVFGDLDDPNSEVHRLTQSRRAYRLDEGLGTEPKVYFLRPRAKEVG